MAQHKAVTLAVFKTKVKAGEYENSTAAKRALGRAKEMSDAEKDSARAFADKHFGVEKPAKKTSKTAPKAGAKRVPSKAGAKAPAKKTVKTSTKAAPKAKKAATKKAA